jgi:intracellular septation protein A
VIEGVLIPLALFLIGLRVVGVWGAMTIGLVWAYGLIGARLFMRRRIPGILLLGTVTLTARTVIALSAHSITLYFLQPSLGSVLIAGAFLVSVLVDRPLAARLAGDFCPLSTELHANVHVRRFFRQISLLWAFAQAANAGVTIWLLFSQSIGTFVVLRSVVSLGVTVLAILASSLWFRTSMSRNGIDVIWPRLRAVRA